MESKLNYKAIEAYAEEYSTKLCNQLYQDKETLSGDEILNFPVKQHGLFVLNRIYQMWALEAEKLKSPFFNYEANDVQENLQKLMNVLSKNILVSRGALEPVVSASLYDSLLLLTSPYNYYKSLLEKEDTNLSVLKGTVKFVAVNKGFLNMIIDKISTSEGLLDQPVNLLDEVFNEINEDPLNPEEELKKYAELHPLEERDFYLEGLKESVMPARDFDDEEELDRSEKTLNDTFDGGSYQTVADTLSGNQKATTLKSMLSINQKFMFINDLFNDNQEDFNKVLDFLESCEDKEAANSFIHNNYLKNNVWKINAPRVKEFLALLDKKFSD